MSNEKVLATLSMIIAFAVTLIVGVVIGTFMSKEQSKKMLIEQGYYPLTEVMQLNGYQESEAIEYGWNKQVSDVSITVAFDFESETCLKNDYQFSLEKAYIQEAGEMYIYKDTIEAILNCKLSYSDSDRLISVPISYEPHQWTIEFAPLIAHAGGAVRGTEYNSFYCNSIEALVENYNLGHRVFEFDFYLTSDNKLAVVHDWNHQGNFNGEALSEEEWRNSIAYGTPEGEFTPMMVDDLLDEMLVNKDVFVVTDTKFTGEEARIQFQLIYDAAMERDTKLLDRIIPQIYNEEMYDIVMSIYEFPSVIYTVYATGAIGDDIINFATAKNNIKVITAPIGDARFDVNAIAKLHDNELLIYNHTIYSYEELTEGKSKGIDGFYSSILLPRDMQLYETICD